MQSPSNDYQRRLMLEGVQQLVTGGDPTDHCNYYYYLQTWLDCPRETA